MGKKQVAIKLPIKIKKEDAFSSQNPSPFELTLNDRLFVNLECEEWYNKRVNNKILAERTLDLMLDYGLQVIAMFRCIGWGPILNLRGAYYPTWIREFYANMKDKKHLILRTIDTIVRGVSIHLTREHLVEILCISDKRS
jgi:hypothetical protein